MHFLGASGGLNSGVAQSLKAPSALDHVRRKVTSRKGSKKENPIEKLESSVVGGGSDFDHMVKTRQKDFCPVEALKKICL